MVKGVSKTVIVVNNTGSKLFEKIVFYVTPEYGNLNAKQLKRAASNFTFNYDNIHHRSKNSLRRKIKIRRNLLILFLFMLGLASIIALICLLL